MPGLRREEVARLAGVSTDYYTRLEQGRHPNVSESVLTSIARALRLSDDERGYLFTLARPAPAGPQRRRPPRVSRTRPVVDRMVQGLGEVTPAFVIDYRQEVLAANGLARALIADSTRCRTGTATWPGSSCWTRPPETGTRTGTR